MIHYINDNYTINKLDPNKNDNIIFLNLKEGNNNAEYNTDLLQRMIEAYPKGQKKFFIKSGEYYFNSLNLNSINTNYLEVNLIGEPIDESTEYSYTKAKPVIIRTNKQDFLHLSKEKPPESRFNVANIWFKSYDGYSEIPTGVCLGCSTNTNGAECNFHLNNVEFHGYDYAVISKGYSCGASGGKRVGFSVCHYGIFIEAANHMFDLENVDILYCRVGIRLSHGGVRNTIRGVHVATGYLGADKDDFNEFIVIHTKGQTTVDSLYYEDYENTAQPEKTIIFDFEGWSYGCGHMTIKNTNIGKPGARGGKWLRARGRLGAGIECGVENPTTISNKGGLMGWYPTGLVKLENCGVERYVYGNKLDDLLTLIDVDNQSNFIHGIVTGYNIKNNRDKIMYGKPCYASKVHIESKWSTSVSIFGITPSESDSDYGYVYRRIDAGAWSEVQSDTGLKHNEYMNKELYTRLLDFKVQGIITITQNDIPEGLTAELGILAFNFSDGKRIFKPITEITKDTQLGTQIRIDTTIPANDFAGGIAFAYRFPSDVDLSNFDGNLIRFSINIDYISENF